MRAFKGARNPCPDCNGSGRSADRYGLCQGCGGDGERKDWHTGAQLKPKPPAPPASQGDNGSGELYGLL